MAVKGIRDGGVSCLISLATVALVLILIFAGLLWLFAYPLPVPVPYPGTTVNTIEQGVGQWGVEQIQTYEVNRSIDEMQRYYESQMAYYCGEKIDFKESATCQEGVVLCRVAECKIPWHYQTDILHGQWFDVQLYPLAETATRIIQTNAWTQ